MALLLRGPCEGRAVLSGRIRAAARARRFGM